MENDLLVQNWLSMPLSSLLMEVSDRNKNNVDYPVLSVTNTKGFVLQSEHFARSIHSSDTQNYKVISKGEFGYNPARINVGSIARLDNFEKGLLSPMYVIFKTKKELNSDYFKYILQSHAFNEQVKANVAGSVRQSLNFSAFKNFKTLLPPLAEQKKIAKIISIVDDEIQKIDDIIAATEKLKSGLMQDLFVKGIGHSRFKETEIGTIPEKWEVFPLSRIAKVERGKFSHRPRNDPDFYGGTIPFIQTGDVVNSNGLIKEYSQTLNEKGLSVSKMFKEGTIVLTIAANIGDTGILEFDCCFPDSLVGITPFTDMDGIFLEYYLRTRKPYLNEIATQSAQKNINLEKLNPLLVIKPPLKEQLRIAEILSAVDQKILMNISAREGLTKMKQGLMQDLFSGRVRVGRV